MEDNIGQANETIIYAFEDVSIKSVGYNEKLLHNLGLIYASPATVAWPPCTSRPIFAFYCSNKNYRKSVEFLLYQFKHLLSCSISATVARHRAMVACEALRHPIWYDHQRRRYPYLSNGVRSAEIFQWNYHIHVYIIYQFFCSDVLSKMIENVKHKWHNTAYSPCPETHPESFWPY